VVRAVGKVLGFEREGAIPLEAAPDPRNRTVQEISGIDLHGWFRGQALERAPTIRVVGADGEFRLAWRAIRSAYYYFRQV
jgi:hypothetical protein